MKRLSKNELVFYILFVTGLTLVMVIWYLLALINKGVL
jgi:hypothetical protein